MGSAKQILVYFKDSEARKSILSALGQDQRLDLNAVGDSVSALKALSSPSISAVICDVELGELDGWRFARLIRSGALAVNANLPIIMVSRSHSARIANATAKTFQINHYVAFDQLHTLPDIVQGALDPHQKGLSKPRLLVIEDYSDTVVLITRVLSDRFEIDIAANGLAGLETWKKRRHELVLLDVMLPGMSGIDVLKEILKLSPAQSVVMMTAHSSAERASELILAGAVDFIPKPFRAEQLRRVCDIAEQRQDFIVSNQEFAQRQDALFREKELAQTTLQSIADGVITTNLDGIIEYLNPVAVLLSGWSLAEARGKTLNQILKIGDEMLQLQNSDAIAACLASGHVIQGVHAATFLNRDGRELKLDYIVSPIRDRRERVVGAVIVLRDVSEAFVLETKLEYQAKHDALTGLTNRSAFEDRLQLALDERNRESGAFSLCYIDLDQFKIVNDTCGHAAGDQLLRQIKTIMLSKIRRHRDTLSRFGGDEFVLLLEDCPQEQATKVAQHIIDALQEHRFSYAGKTFSIGASIGVVPISEEFNDVNEILRAADNACYIAKEKGRGRVHVYHAQDQELIKRHSEMNVVARINKALEEDGLGLFYQTIAPLAASSKGLHIEILIRMRDENGAWVTPGFFLPAAERYNIAPKIDRWVIANTLSTFASRPELFSQIELCSINLSGVSFRDEHFIKFIGQQFKVSGLPANKFCFEVTETAAISNLDQATDFISQIKSLGCQFALDDFGSGMSSYAYLKALPVDYLKIDGMFIRGILDDPVDHAMVRSINEIGHVLGLQTIAEFVETQAIIDALKLIEVDFVQGYGIHKPAHIDTLADANPKKRLKLGT
ncbi:MAG: EAL domain-containing protein [Gammaproteobacteria bacterium]|nr:EAL domain-containing protein [Gammaproteobacteria bacterium]